MSMNTCRHCNQPFADWVDWCPHCKRLHNPIPVMAIGFSCVVVCDICILIGDVAGLSIWLFS